MDETDVKTFFNHDRTRKVVIFQRPDGTFGFEESKYMDGVEDAFPPGIGEIRPYWLPLGHSSWFDTLEVAVREAKSRVPWLAKQEGMASEEE